MPEKNLKNLESPLKLMISSRDPAAALQMTAICKAAALDPRFLLTVVAQSPAAEILQHAGIEVWYQRPICVDDAHSTSSEELLSLATALLEKHQPDILLCGLSSPGEAGIDEALMSQRKVPGLLLQDFWGEQNNFFNRSPDMALVLDTLAARQTQVRHGTATRITGSPRHGNYAKLDIASVRGRIRTSLGMPGESNGTVLGLFGQPLHVFDGYRTTLQTWIDAARGLARPATILYRPHPRETAEGKAWTENWLRQSGMPTRIFDTGSTEEALAACDTACTVLSNCAYDAAYLNYFSRQPLVVPLLLLFDAELQAFYAKTIDIHRLPYIEQRLANAVWHGRNMSAALEASLQPSNREAVWLAAKNLLPDPSKAIDEVLDALWETATHVGGPRGTGTGAALN